MHFQPTIFLLTAVLICSGCATKIPREWGKPAPLNSPAELNGSYEDRCIEISGNDRDEVSLVQTMGFVEDYKADIAYSVDVKADEYGLQMLFHRPFEKTAAIQARYSMKDGWLTLKDYDATLESSCSDSGCLALPFGNIQRLNLTKTNRGDLLITRTNRPMMLLLIPLPEEDWALRCKAAPDFDPTSLLPLPAAEKTPKPALPPAAPTTPKAATTDTPKEPSQPKEQPAPVKKPAATETPPATGDQQ